MRGGKAAVRAGSGLVERAACKRLAQLAGEVRTRHAIVELGAYRGRSTGWLVAGSNGAHVWSVDPWEHVDQAVTDEYAAGESGYRSGAYAAAGVEWAAHMEACRITPTMVTPLAATALEAAATWNGCPVGLLFHDAYHTREAVAADLEAWIPHLAPSCVVALHDVGQQAFGVEAGAGDVLPAAGFDWDGRQRLLWKKDPGRRGLLVVRR